MKTKILFFALIIVCVSLIASGTIAYFTDEDKAHNVITTGSVDVSVEEWTVEDGEIVPYPDEPVSIMPGATVSKIVTVKNEDADAFIRVRYDMIIKDSEGNVIDIGRAELENMVLISLDTESWEMKAEHDGWYYYNSPVTAGVATVPLFEEVYFSGEDITNELKNATFEINVYAQAVQAANNASTAIDAVGWPEE